MDVTIGDLTKLILYVSISISIVGVSYQIMRLISALVGNVNDLRITVKNIGVITSELVEDQKLIKSGIQRVLKIIDKVNRLVEHFSSKIIGPINEISKGLKAVAAFVSMIRNKVRR